MGVEYCFVWTWPCLPPEAWAAWVQAVGSIAAILATVWVMHRQHALQLKAQETARRQHEMLQCNRALLAVQGYHRAVTAAAEYFASVPPEVPGRNYLLQPCNGNWILDVDLDSLAFLVAKNAQLLLNRFSQMLVMATQWSELAAALSNFRTSRLEDVLVERQKENGMIPMQPQDLATHAGPQLDNVLRLRTEDLEMVTMQSSRAMGEALGFLRNEVLKLYPETVLPDLDAE